MIRVDFACGHSLAIGDSANAAPRCAACGEVQVRRVTTSRPPRFTGTVTGPYADFKGLDPGVVNVAPAGPLRLKEQQ